MDRRNGGSNHLAPPRPPKSIPRVHRPRAPDPDIDTVDSSPSIHIISTHPPSISRMNSNIINNSSSSINSSSNSTTTTTTTNHRSIPSIPPPVTAPLTPLQHCRNSSNNNNSNSNNLTSSTASSTISTFSRRRTEMTTPQQRVISSSSSSITSNSATNNIQRSLTPSSLITPTANLISNAINAVVRRSPSPVNSSNNSNSNSVTLQLPRPENERLPNEYVDTPFTNPNHNKLTTPGSRHSLATSTVPNRNNNQLNGHTNISIIDGTSVLNNNNNNNNNNINNNNLNNNSNKVNLPNRTAGVQRPNLLPITKQPSFRNTNTLNKKDASVLHQQFSHCPEIINSQNATNNNGMIITNASDRLNSITCPQCNRCRCEECQRPRQLPYKWICNDNFLCSAETIIDYASCLCCVKGLYYHCAKDHELDCDSETIRCAEDPCSCAPYKRASRWGCLTALSLLLPCLLCYWPMRGCVSLCAKCYAKHSRHGCRCNNNSSSANNSRLNIINLASSPGQEQISNHHYHRQSSNINDLTPEKRLLANEY